MRGDEAFDPENEEIDVQGNDEYENDGFAVFVDAEYEVEREQEREQVDEIGDELKLVEEFVDVDSHEPVFGDGENPNQEYGEHLDPVFKVRDPEQNDEHLEEVLHKAPVEVLEVEAVVEEPELDYCFAVFEGFAFERDPVEAKQGE